MSAAGFYHNPSTNGEDRAFCFTCNVCLVSWEPNDEPWSEHERHSPFCPFVRGEHTQNVPLSLSYATAPSFTVKNAEYMGTQILGKSSYANGFALGFSNGLVILWDIGKHTKVSLSKFPCVISWITNILYEDMSTLVSAIVVLTELTQGQDSVTGTSLQGNQIKGFDNRKCFRLKYKSCAFTEGLSNPRLRKFPLRPMRRERRLFSNKGNC